jgi:hypothetical protein
MPDVSEDRLFQILSAEQQHIDRQVESMMNFQTKILAFLFPALGVAAGWILTTPDKNNQHVGIPGQAAILLIVDGLMCFGALLSVICYAWSAEYSRYKKDVLGPRFGHLLLPDSHNPLDSASFGKSAEGFALKFALGAFWIVIAAAMAADLSYATHLVWRPAVNTYLEVATGACWLLSALSIAAAMVSAGNVFRHLRRKSVRSRI